MNVDVNIALPEDESAGELVKGYYTLMKAFGWDLYVTAHFALRESHGPHWFAERLGELTREDPTNWNPNHKFEPQDCSVVLRDYVFERDTPYASVFGAGSGKRNHARKILGTRNTWFHFGGDPTLAQLTEAAKVVHSFVAESGMHIQPRVGQLIARLESIHSGSHPAHSAAVADRGTGSQTVAESEDAILELPADLPRPSIGGTWIGQIPQLRYRITRSRDIIHPDTMESLRTQMVGDFDEKFRAWTAVEPRGREVWVDLIDGALGGYIGATPRLLGYLGTDPVDEVARGFFLPHYYYIDEDTVVDLDTEERLKWDPSANVASGTFLRVTTYGDVISVADAHGVERIATVTDSEWFPGHLS
ncbi:hypothetical protein [Salinibacterium sp. SWN167]|uniref:hypothetical protein n=1 Tax=Salinibacterium sp. SWN167 TaxID=2792054 RepID=UPI0018CFE45F|nr:hypothetical protein [Salinibacterium sp. SWN167]MBH0081960.1 hypothetical protein [Salinibacterium sp. SWN167]